MDKGHLVRRTLQTFSKLEVRENQPGQKKSRTITGYAILFNRRSAALYSDDTEEEYEVIAPSAVTRSLLDNSDIIMTMFHDRQLLLARSNKGKGTLKYQIDTVGVKFSFEAPNTTDGDKALELVRRGDIAGCSFAFSTYYYDSSYVSRQIETIGGKKRTISTVRKIVGIYDFTLAENPAYPDTSVSARERSKQSRILKQISEMREAANQSII